ncbi:hypothetical protein [Streptomyces sp. 900105245]
MRISGGDDVRQYWYRYRRIQAEREMLLRILEWRGIPVTSVVRSRVAACGSQDLLTLWMRRAVHAVDAAEVYAEE